jgi:hypothetical protein
MAGQFHTLSKISHDDMDSINLPYYKLYTHRLYGYRVSYVYISKLIKLSIIILKNRGRGCEGLNSLAHNAAGGFVNTWKILPCSVQGGNVSN